MVWYPIYKTNQQTALTLCAKSELNHFMDLGNQGTKGPQVTFTGFTLCPFFFPFLLLVPPFSLLSLLSLAFPYSLARLLGIEPRAGQVLYH